MRALRPLIMVAALALVSCGPPAPRSAVAPDWVDTLPPSRRGVLMIEGMPESTTFVLDRTLDTTMVFYRPADLVAVPGGLRIDLFFRERSGPHVASIDFDTTRDVGARAMVLGHRKGRAYRLTRHYPLEMGDGMGPRLASIVDSWIWTDTGESLATSRRWR